ncbi:zinc finger CCCH domain-containing protein 16 isoform X2 [Malania oleifera]|uniref:zinc finger CCCH domain-containing protein 16 isoform X2 n=1 Tax=Malania oleifera TaxID=397392 RepID=UPI0025AE548B|nr:zinc finger CCCH domain-containing protein 16 isoform X2 [Malania oleifera]
MPVKKELCRNFQRGSCHYGERCKFLHVTQQQPKRGVLGFGAQTASHFNSSNSQQQKLNPFGFSVQNSTQPKGVSDFGSKPRQFKPFENKWTRSSAATANSPSSWQPDNQPQAASHKCTDLDSCKREIVQDFEHERPLWKLTCYGHCKSSPCDIVGDISYEELRAAAYNDAVSGLSLQSIVDRERSLLNSKLIEFESLLQNPHAARSNSTLVKQDPDPGASVSTSVLIAKNSCPPSVSSFSQLGASLNMVSGMMSASAPPNNSFGQSNSLQNSGQMSGVFGIQNLPSGGAGSFGGQLSAQTPGNSFATKPASFSNSFLAAGSNAFPLPVASQQTPASSPSSMLSSEPKPAHDVGQAASSVHLLTGSWPHGSKGYRASKYQGLIKNKSYQLRNCGF